MSFWCLHFLNFQTKTSRQVVKSNLFVRFFGRNVGLKKSFRICLDLKGTQKKILFEMVEHKNAVSWIILPHCNIPFLHLQVVSTIYGKWLSCLPDTQETLNMRILLLEKAKYFCFENKNNVQRIFSNFSCMFLNPNIFSNLNYNCSNLWEMRNLQEQVIKAFCYQTLFWPFTVWINCSSDH